MKTLSRITTLVLIVTNHQVMKIPQIISMLVKLKKRTLSKFLLLQMKNSSSSSSITSGNVPTISGSTLLINYANFKVNGSYGSRVSVSFRNKQIKQKRCR